MEVSKLTILGGTDKAGGREPVVRIDAAPGEMIALVGPTGSGKSRLLADVEWLARGDSPTGRKVLINDVPADELPEEASNAVARLSQSMMYQLDMKVGDFLRKYTSVRNKEDAAQEIEQVMDWANRLSGECFGADTPLAALSGGQARALMISESAIISGCGVILIDEIENAGIDRIKALDFLAGEGRVALLATHDPLLALRCGRRIVFANGAMTEVRSTSDEEKVLLQEIEENDRRVEELRGRLRSGKKLE